jgi:hypothetical protein
VTTDLVVEVLVSHCRRVGLPTCAQLDNDTRFQGSRQFRDAIGRVARLCLSLGVIPLFTPVQEHGFQGAIESFNGRWRAKVWERFHYECVASLQGCSAQYIAAHRQQAPRRLEAAPPRRSFPPVWRFDPQALLRGRIVFLRRTSPLGAVALLGHVFPVESGWPHRLVRCELDLQAGRIQFYALRRREPTAQPLLREVANVWPGRQRDRVASS